MITKEYTQKLEEIKECVFEEIFQIIKTHYSNLFIGLVSIEMKPSKDTTFGSFWLETNTVEINSFQTSVKDLVTVVLHELRHNYQVNGGDEQLTKKCIESGDLYSKGLVSWEDAYHERDAIAFSEREGRILCDTYKDLIEHYEHYWTYDVMFHDYRRRIDLTKS